jgi:hypothetical protein
MIYEDLNYKINKLIEIVAYIKNHNFCHLI